LPGGSPLPPPPPPPLLLLLRTLVRPSRERVDRAVPHPVPEGDIRWDGLDMSRNILLSTTEPFSFCNRCLVMGETGFSRALFLVATASHIMINFRPCRPLPDVRKLVSQKAARTTPLSDLVMDLSNLQVRRSWGISSDPTHRTWRESLIWSIANKVERGVESPQGFLGSDQRPVQTTSSQRRKLKRTDSQTSSHSLKDLFASSTAGKRHICAVCRIYQMIEYAKPRQAPSFLLSSAAFRRNGLEGLRDPDPCSAWRKPVALTAAETWVVFMETYGV
jgi:hypothetical protein